MTQTLAVIPLPAPAARTGEALAAVGGALAFGFATQALFWDASPGLNFVGWTALAVGVGLARLRAPGAGLAPWATGAAAVVASSAVALRASDWSLAIAIPSTVLWLALFGASLVGARPSELPMALLRLLARTPAGAIDAARAPARATSAEARPVLVRIALGLGIGLPTAALFVVLLSTDSSFRDALGRIVDRAGNAAGFTAAAIATSFGALTARGMLRATPPAGEAEAALSAGPYRTTEEDTSPRAPRAVVTPLTWGLVLAQVALVFALFAAVNLRHLFGGLATIRSERSLTYAAYLHSGFGELVIAALLTVGLVVAGHALVTPIGERKARGGRALAAIEVTLLALAALVLVSCAQRLFIYEDAYGATHLRLGVLAVELGLGATLAVTAGKSVARGWRGFGVALAASTLGVASVAGLFDADAYIARRNLDRAAAGKTLDEAYLASLGPDACRALGHPAIAAREGLEERLRDGWNDARPTGLRSRRGVISCAR